MNECEMWALGAMLLFNLLVIAWFNHQHTKKMGELDAIRNATLKLFYKYQGKIQSLDREGE